MSGCCAASGLEPEGRKFVPHVSLARLRGTSAIEVADFIHHAGQFAPLELHRRAGSCCSRAATIVAHLSGAGKNRNAAKVRSVNRRSNQTHCTFSHSSGARDLATLERASPLYSAGRSAIEENNETSVDLNDLFSAVGDAVVVSDASGAITLWNKAAERLFGYTEAEALGQSLDLMIPERQRAKHCDGYQKTRRPGPPATAPKCCRFPPSTKPAARSRSHSRSRSSTRPTKGVSGIAAVIRDDTRRFEKDRAQRKRFLRA